MAMDISSMPHKIEVEVATYDATQWTEDQVRNGEAVPTRTDTSVTWYEPGPDGPVEVTDPARIAELEATTQEGS